jgi:DNA-binding NarL/FixJ family response regulator
LSWVVKELAQRKGWSERDVLIDLTQLGKEQLHNAKKMVELWRTLSVREQEVVALVCMGLRNYEIAQTMSITYGTATSHLKSVFKKLNLHERGASG